MARLSDLPPEVRLKIYDLLLVDPIREGLRIKFALDLRKGSTIKRSRSRYMKSEGLSIILDHSDAFLHHLDSTDLMSLATTNKTLYTEASQTIYNNADLTLSNHLSLRTPKLAHVLMLLRRYLEQHCFSTRKMLLSLVIHDNSTSTSSGDARSIVDLINTQLPKLRVFEYHVVTDDCGSPLPLMSSYCKNYARAIKTVQPFVGLKAGIRTTLDLPIPTEPRLRDSPYYPSLCKIRQRFIEEALEALIHLRELRSGVHELHTWAVDRGGYLHATQALRADLDEDVLPRLPDQDEALAGLHFLSTTLSSHRAAVRDGRKSS